MDYATDLPNRALAAALYEITRKIYQVGAGTDKTSVTEGPEKLLKVHAILTNY